MKIPQPHALSPNSYLPLCRLSISNFPSLPLYKTPLTLFCDLRRLLPILTKSQLATRKSQLANRKSQLENRYMSHPATMANLLSHDDLQRRKKMAITRIHSLISDNPDKFIRMINELTRWDEQVASNKPNRIIQDVKQAVAERGSIKAEEFISLRDNFIVVWAMLPQSANNEVAKSVYQYKRQPLAWFNKIVEEFRFAQLGQSKRYIYFSNIDFHKPSGKHPNPVDEINQTIRESIAKGEHDYGNINDDADADDNGDQNPAPDSAPSSNSPARKKARFNLDPVNSSSPLNRTPPRQILGNPPTPTRQEFGSDAGSPNDGKKYENMKAKAKQAIERANKLSLESNAKIASINQLQATVDDLRQQLRQEKQKANQFQLKLQSAGNDKDKAKALARVLAKLQAKFDTVEETTRTGSILIEKGLKSAGIGVDDLEKILDDDDDNALQNRAPRPANRPNNPPRHSFGMADDGKVFEDAPADGIKDEPPAYSVFAPPAPQQDPATQQARRRSSSPLPELDE